MRFLMMQRQSFTFLPQQRSPAHDKSLTLGSPKFEEVKRNIFELYIHSSGSLVDSPNSLLESGKLRLEG